MFEKRTKKFIRKRKHVKVIISKCHKELMQEIDFVLQNAGVNSHIRVNYFVLNPLRFILKALAYSFKSI